jgi:ATP-dependent DNA helicase RecG
MILTNLLIPNSRKNLFQEMGLSNHNDNKEKYLDPLVKYGLISLLYPENLTHPKQGYKTTDIGKRILALLHYEN